MHGQTYSFRTSIHFSMMCFMQNLQLNESCEIMKALEQSIFGNLSDLIIWLRYLQSYTSCLVSINGENKILIY